MNSIGLKLWNINIDHFRRCAKELYSSKCFDYIELYIVPGRQETLSCWKELNIPFDVHAPHYAHGMNLSSLKNYAINKSYCYETLNFADELDARYIVFHGGVDGSHHETARQLAALNDSRIVIENKPYFTLPFVEGDHYIGSTPEEIADIMEVAQCGFCLDIGHAITSANGHGIVHEEMLSRFLALGPCVIHLSDLDVSATMDMHLNYGSGNLDFRTLLQMLPANIPITIETAKANVTNLDAFQEDVTFLKTALGDARTLMTADS